MLCHADKVARDDRGGEESEELKGRAGGLKVDYARIAVLYKDL